MVAYSFKARFAPSILDGTKTGTIRAPRVRGHAEVGAALQLYTGLRTKQTKLILRTTCSAVALVRLRWRPVIEFEVDGERVEDLDRFAQHDGFADVRDMEAFWRETHPRTDVFMGTLIQWPAHAESACDGRTHDAMPTGAVGEAS